MEIIRNDQYILLPVGDTHQTYTWLQRIRSGETAAARTYVEELEDHVPGFGDRARVLEEQRVLTPEEHMQIIRAHDYVLPAGGDTRQTCTWLQHVKRGATAAARTHVEELKGMAPDFGDDARILEEQRVLTPEEHMQIIRSCRYTLLPGGTTQQTYRWFHDVRSGATPVTRTYVEELAQHVDGFGDHARVLEEQTALTPEEHMQIIRAHDYALHRGGATQQTYTWLHNVKGGVTPVMRTYVEELAQHVDGFGDHARVLEEQRALTPEEHMQIIRAHDYALHRGGAAQQTYKWFHNVISGRSRIAETYLREIEEAKGTRFPAAQVIEEKQELTQADHMKILRSRGFHVSPRGSTQLTFEWLMKAMAGEVKNLRTRYAREITAMIAGVAGQQPRAGADGQPSPALRRPSARW
ncbi:hypothetical protein ACIQB5_48935 [Streptomyces sp. NPDC088560]|uniref:hypothetical protein n=1 Tax=Streptomyces sp. NPDC088560 TaxID=3365868 RepID=UPI003808C6CE